MLVKCLQRHDLIKDSILYEGILMDSHKQEVMSNIFIILCDLNYNWNNTSLLVKIPLLVYVSIGKFFLYKNNCKQLNNLKNSHKFDVSLPLLSTLKHKDECNIWIYHMLLTLRHLIYTRNIAIICWFEKIFDMLHVPAWEKKLLKMFPRCDYYFLTYQTNAIIF